jgi:glucose-1-phosphate cytidylyltransferase
MRDGEELVLEPFQRLIQEKQLMAYEHHGFYASMDTFKDKQQLDDLYARGDAPWVVWKSDATPASGAAPSAVKTPVREPAGYVASRRDG